MSVLREQREKQIVRYIGQNPDCRAKDISIATGIDQRRVSDIVVKLRAAGKLNYNENTKSYSSVTVPVENMVKKEGKNFGRDFSKMSFRGVMYRKGKWSHAASRVIAETLNLTYSEFNAIFFGLVRGWGFFATLEEARTINQKGPQRYFSQHNMVITLADGVKVCVTNQISKDNMPGIIDAMKKAVKGTVLEEEFSKF